MYPSNLYCITLSASTHERNINRDLKGQDNLLQEFQEKMGVQLKWQGLLTKENTYLIVLGGILLASILWIVLVKRTSQKK